MVTPLHIQRGHAYWYIKKWHICFSCKVALVMLHEMFARKCCLNFVQSAFSRSSYIYSASTSAKSGMGNVAPNLCTKIVAWNFGSVRFLESVTSTPHLLLGRCANHLGIAPRFRGNEKHWCKKINVAVSKYLHEILTVSCNPLVCTKNHPITAICVGE